MGLDMYLYREVYIGANYHHNNVTGKIELYQNESPIFIDFYKVSAIKEQVGYWRKAQAIHNWIVENVQDGVDNCGTYYVSRNQLRDLRKNCKEILRHPDMAEELIPSFSYDDYYFEDLEFTVKMLDEVLMIKDGEFYYHSSW